MSNPVIINSWNRVAMRRIRSFPDEDRVRMLDIIPRDTQNAIARAKADEWLAAEHAVAVCDALVEVLGAERAFEFWRDIVHDSWVGGLLGPLAGKMKPAEGEIRAIGEGVLNLAPSAWLLSARNCGEIVAHRDDEGRLKLEARNLPPTVKASTGIRVMYAGAVKGMLGFSGLSADVEILDRDDMFAFKLSLKKPDATA
jgi:hypothetical protein